MMWLRGISSPAASRFASGIAGDCLDTARRLSKRLARLFNRTLQARAFQNARACGVRLYDRAKPLIEDRTRYKSQTSRLSDVEN